VSDVAGLVGTLRDRGVTLKPDGDLLRIRPASMVSPDEKAALRVHKAEVLALLRSDPAEVVRVLGLPLDQLDRILEVRVPWWPDGLWFVPTEADAEMLCGEGITRGRVWTARELQDLLTITVLTKTAVRTVAEAKLAMDGDVAAVRSASHDRYR
jgi:TubC N-terminal docking domain